MNMAMEEKKNAAASADSASADAPSTVAAPTTTTTGEKSFDYIKTTTGNFVSRQAEIHEAQHVEIKGRSWIEAGVVLRGDRAKIRIGKYCQLSTGTLLEPAPITTTTASTGSNDNQPTQQQHHSQQYVPLVIGSHTMIGPHCTIRAAAIGSYCWIGHDVTMGSRVIIKDACVIDDFVTIGDDTVIPPFTRVTTLTIDNDSSSSPNHPPHLGSKTTTTTQLLQMIELPPATIQLLQEESMEIYNRHRQSLLQQKQQQQ